MVLVQLLKLPQTPLYWLLPQSYPFGDNTVDLDVKIDEIVREPITDQPPEVDPVLTAAQVQKAQAANNAQIQQTLPLKGPNVFLLHSNPGHRGQEDDF